jgi:hypothetical protein
MNMKRLLSLYPRSWRDRYADEAAVVLEQQPVSLKGVLDVTSGALDAHLHPQYATGRGAVAATRLRTSALTIFCAYVGFALAYITLQRLADPQAPYDAVARAHADVGVTFIAIVAGSVLAALAVVAGGLPIAWVVVRRALAARRRDILALCLVPPLALASFAGWTLVVARLVAPAGTPPRVSTALQWALVVSWEGLAVLTVLASTAAIVLAITRGEVSAALLRFALAPAAIATAAMGLTLAATVVWGVSVTVYAPHLFDRDIGAIWFLGVVGLMAISTGVAGVSLRAGYAARVAA